MNATQAGEPLRHWRKEADEVGIVWLYFDKADAGTNVLSEDALAELRRCLEEIAESSPAGVVIASAKPSGFIAGADVKSFQNLRDANRALELIRTGQSIMDQIEALPCPVVAAIHGFCLGGGLELALACRYRVADSDPRTRLGLPEVRLGIHPGFGGTVRATRILGAPVAMDLMLSGRTVSARAAARIGLVDYAVPMRQLHAAARALIQKPPPPRRPKGLAALAGMAPLRPVLAWWMRRQVAKRARPDHYPAPYALIELWLDHAGDPERMMQEEAASVARLITGDTAQNLVRVFLLQDRLKALGKKRDLTPRHVHVIGAGVMGGDIAAWCALQELQVTLQDRTGDAIAPAIRRARELYAKRLKAARPIQAALDRLLPDVRGVGAGKADVVIEAIFENVEAKQSLFRDLEPRLKAEAILASNTSSIPLEKLAESLSQPQRLVGLHFFNPVAKMPLVEVVVGSASDPEQVRKACAFARHIDRLPLPVKSSPGFLVNRILMPYLIEAVRLDQEGIPAAVIDAAAVRFGMPMGPVELADSVGLDICLSVAELLAPHMQIQVPERLRSLAQQGRRGRKTGAGFYTWRKGKARKPKPPRAYRPPEDLTDRLIYPMLNEAVACWREAVVEGEELVDAGVIFGTGFAPFRGGPMHYLRSIGIETVLHRMRALQSRYGDRFRPDAGWDALRSSASSEGSE